MGYSIFTDTMADMTWKEIEKAAKEDMPVLLGLGVIEEHGPHLPLGTDCYLAYDSCRQTKEGLKKLGCNSLIAPPFYWGINSVTGAFPGSFSSRPETMKMLLEDIFQNLAGWGFHHIFCFNAHGDAKHIKTGLDTIKESRERLGINIRMVAEPAMMDRFHLTGEEDYILSMKPDFAELEMEAEEQGEEQQGKEQAEEKGEEKIQEKTQEKVKEKPRDNEYDIHAGTYETALMLTYYPDLVDTELAKTLPHRALTNENIDIWLKGGMETRELVPEGYAGNPSEYEKITDIPKMDQLLSICGAKYILKCMEKENEKAFR